MSRLTEIFRIDEASGLGMQIAQRKDGVHFIDSAGRHVCVIPWDVVKKHAGPEGSAVMMKEIPPDPTERKD